MGDQMTAAQLLRKVKAGAKQYAEAWEKSFAWLVVGLINEHFPYPDEGLTVEDDVIGTAGCVINCGPCGALHWFSMTEQGRKDVDRYVCLTGFQEGSWSYWDAEADSLRWDWFETYWAGHKACWTDGAESGCRHEDDETASRHPAAELHAEGSRTDE